MLNTPITPPRVPIIDPRTGLIDRAWYMFFLSLFQSATTNANIPDVGPDNAGVIEQINELAKALQSTLIGPANASVLEQINELTKQLKALQVEPANAGVLEQISELAKVVANITVLSSPDLVAPANVAVVEQISELSKQLKALQVEPANAGVVEQISELAKVVAALTIVSSPDLVAPENVAVVEQISELAKQLQSALVGPANAGVADQIGEFAKQLTAFQIGPTSNGLLEQITALRNEVQAFYLLPSNQPSATGVTSVDGSGGATGLTLTGGPITSAGTLTLGGTLAIASGGTGSTSTTYVNLATNVTGILPIANGGIGATTFASAGLPTLSGNNTFSGVITTTGQSNQLTALTYATTDGVGGLHAYFGENSSYAVIGGVNGVVLASGATYPGTARYSADSVSFRPYASSLYSLGTASQQWTSIYANELIAGASGAAEYKENSGYAFVNGTSGVVTAYAGTGITVTQATGFRPFADNAYTLGTGPQRWSEVYAANGTINTSDATEKQQIRELNDAERRTAQRIKGLIRAFKWNAAVEAKGDGARIHIGVIAQDVQAAFTAEGLDASKYGLFCSDTWTTLDGNSQTRLGVRYEELLAFVIGSL